MENQHRKIVGYRELSQEDIDLMNRIKAAGRELLVLQAAVAANCRQRQSELQHSVGGEHDAGEYHEKLQQFLLAEPHRWASIAKTDLQTGVMALVRAVAQPTDR